MKVICPFCGVGCRLEYRDGRLWPDPTDPVSQGHPCIKGLRALESVELGKEGPMVRDGYRKEWEPVDLEYALDYVADNLRDPYFVGSGETSNEDNYLLQKLAREVFETNDVDTTARLCHAVTVRVFKESLGIGASPGRISDLDEIDALLMVGTNPAVTYPAVMSRILRNKIRVFYIHYLPTETAKLSHASLIVKPGTEAFVLLGVSNLLFGDFPDYGPGRVASIAGVSEKKLRKFAEEMKKHEKWGVMHGMGITQSLNGDSAVSSLLHLALRLNAKILTQRGKINIQGAGDVGCEPTGSTLVEKPEEPGINVVEAFLGGAKSAIILPCDPARSLPDLNAVWEHMKHMFIVQISPYVNTTTSFARVYIPSAHLLHQRGTVTTGERRIRLLRPLGQGGYRVWEIMVKLAERYGERWEYRDEREIFREIVRRVIPYRLVDPDLVYSGVDVYADKKVKKRSVRVEEPRVLNGDLLLVTKRQALQFNTGEMTRKWPGDKRVRVNPKVLRRKRIKGRAVISSGWGEIEVGVVPDKSVPENIVVASFHFEDLPVNLLAPPYTNKSGTPHYKGIPVEIRPA